MRIYVCVKSVPDSAATIKVVAKTKIDERVTFLINPYDEHALTEAHRLKAADPQTEIVAVCLAKSTGETTLRSALAMGADRGILVVSERRYDAIMTARILKTTIELDGRPDLILTGRESIDTEGMQTMFRLARHFDMPAATNVVRVEISDGEAVVTCEKEGGARDMLKLKMPCVLAAGKGLNTPRYPTFPEIVKARKKDIRILNVDTLSFLEPEARVELLNLAAVVEERDPQEIAGSPESIARQLVDILKGKARVL